MLAPTEVVVLVLECAMLADQVALIFYAAAAGRMFPRGWVEAWQQVWHRSNVAITHDIFPSLINTGTARQLLAPAATAFGKRDARATERIVDKFLNAAEGLRLVGIEL